MWLQENGFSITEISKILSVALVCSSVLAFLLTFFSSKIRVKNILVLSFAFRSIAMCSLLLVSNSFYIKFAILLGIMCEVIFSIAFYPLLSFETKTDEAYKKKTIIDFVFKDIGIVGCGLLVGVSLGKYVFDYNTCLLISVISSFFGLVCLANYKSSESNRKPSTLFKQLKDIFSLKINRLFLFNQLITNISYGIIFDLMMIILTTYIGFDVAFTSIFIIVCNMLGTICTSILNKFASSYSIAKSAIIKFGIRAIGYLVAFLLNMRISFIIAIIIAHITSRILEEKVTGKFLQIIDENNQFLYSNIRYFTISLGEGIGAAIAGILLSISFKLLFLGASIITIVQTIILIYLGSLRKKVNE